MENPRSKDHKIIVLTILCFLLYNQMQASTCLANEVKLDNSENIFSGNIFWPDFLENCDGENYLDTSGELQDIRANIVFNPDTKKITGSFTAKHIDETYSYAYKENHDIQGTITGIMKKKNDYSAAQYWYWEFSGEIDFVITYRMEKKCNDDTGEYWKTNDQTLNKKGVLTGGTWGDIWNLQIRWEDQETLDGRSRYVQLKTDYTKSHVEFPNPIEIDLEISIPPEVYLDSDSTPFQLSISGRDVDMIDHLDWYFAYWNPELEQYQGLQNEQHFSTTGTSTLKVTEAMRSEWKRLAQELGVIVEDGSEIDLQINLRTIDANGNDLIDNTAFEYTYFSSSSDTQTSGSAGAETSSAETGSETTSTLIPDISSMTSYFSGAFIQGLVSAGAGFGLGNILKRFLPESKNPETKKQLIQKTYGSSKGEDMIKLKNEDTGTPEARRAKRFEKIRKLYAVPPVQGYLDQGLPYSKKGWDIQEKIDQKYDAIRKTKGITLEQEYKEILKNRPEYLEKYVRRYIQDRTLKKNNAHLSGPWGYIEELVTPQQMNEIYQWNEHMHSFHSRMHKLEMESFGTGFAAVIGTRG